MTDADPGRLHPVRRWARRTFYAATALFVVWFILIVHQLGMHIVTHHYTWGSISGRPDSSLLGLGLISFSSTMYSLHVDRIELLDLTLEVSVPRASLCLSDLTRAYLEQTLREKPWQLDLCEGDGPRHAVCFKVSGAEFVFDGERLLSAIVRDGPVLRVGPQRRTFAFPTPDAVTREVFGPPLREAERNIGIH